MSDVYHRKIKRLTFFKDNDMNFISDIFIHSRPFLVKRGQILYREGDLANDIILVSKGSIIITTFLRKKEILNGICTSGGTTI